MKLFIGSTALISLLALQSVTCSFATADDLSTPSGAAGVEMNTLRDLLNDCAFVKPPKLLDATTATPSQMGDLSVTVRSYVDSMETSLSCVDDVETTLGGNISQQQRAAISAIYNNGIAQVNFITSEYNKQVGAYKVRKRAPIRLDHSELGSHH